MSGWFDWFKSLYHGTLAKLGWTTRSGRLVIIGLANAGKTTLVGRLAHGRLVSPLPSTHPCKYEMTLGSLKLSAWDLGGHESVRILWETYGAQADALVFVVDSTEHVPEAAVELRKVLDDAILGALPILVLGNKCDITTAPSCDALQQQLGLFFTTGKQGKAAPGQRPLELFMCSAVAEVGYAEGLQWLSEQLP